jgi:hypothetical protein
MLAGDNNTCDKFFAGINNTDEQLSLLTTTPATTFFPGVVDTGQKYPKSLKFIDGVNNTADKLFSDFIDTAKKLFAGVNDIADKTELTIPACLDLNMKNKQKFNLQEQRALK